jgi:hypothetical protein
MERASVYDELDDLKTVKEEYDELFDLMAEEFDYLAEHRRAGLHMITGDDIARWTEFNRRIKALKERALS